LRTIKEVLGFNIRRLRGNRTQEEMAEFLGLNLRTYQRLEKGTRPQKATMGRVLARLSIPESALFQTVGTGAPEAPSPTAEHLLAALHEQERRIQSLEAQLAAQRVHPPSQGVSTLSPPAGQNFAEPAGGLSPDERELLQAYRAMTANQRGLLWDFVSPPAEESPEFDPSPPKGRHKHR
jgi:transcriptional regulator with XRE-family HTH domain